MDFPISHSHISPVALVLVGFVVGVLGGFFGVGGSFLAGPALFRLGVPMNFVVGTDTAHIVGKSIVATRRHRVLGNVDIKLGLVMTTGTLVGVELGARVVELLKRLGKVDQVIGVAYIVILTGITIFTAYEGWRALQMQREQQRESEDQDAPEGADAGADVLAFPQISEKVHGIAIPPIISFPVSGIQVSLWPIVAVGLFSGFLSGFLGGGAGYVRMPAFVYVIGAPTHVAVGTDLFEVIISAGYGTLTHALKGNVDILIALVMHTGAAIGAQIGATATRFFAGPKIRLAFSVLPFIGVLLVISQLISGAPTH